jgi:shikimate dehydrogenase
MKPRRSPTPFQINGQTRIAAVLGHPIAHTASPAMHNAAFSKLGLNARYVALDVEPASLKEVLTGLAAAGFMGVNLTVPHKILALKHVDKIEKSALQLGAVNAIHVSQKKGRALLHGYNTDGYGLIQALKEDFSFSPKGKTIAILGCGGAGRGVAIQLALCGVRKLILLNRTKSKAQEVARRIRSLKLKTDCAFAPEKCDLLIQATSLGLKASDPLPLSASELKALAPRLLFDIVYRPAETPLMRLAKKQKIRTSNGLGMLLHQGAKAFEIWTGRKAPIEVMRRALKNEIYKH